MKDLLNLSLRTPCNFGEDGYITGMVAKKSTTFTGQSFLEDRQAKRLIEETPLKLTIEKKRHREIFSTILDLAILDGFWSGRGIHFGTPYQA